MWSYRGLKHIRSASHLRSPSRFIDRSFQLRYSAIVIGAATLGVLVTSFPIYYFLSENYRIFVEIAYDQAPALLDDLERERIWIHSLLLAGLTALIVFFSLFSLRMTNRIVGPLKIIRNHLKQLTRGHWHQKPIKIREKDEFQDLIEAYNYFYMSFQTNARRELNLLKKLAVDSNNKDAYTAWVQLMNEKNQQLGLSDHFVESHLFHPDHIRKGA